MNYPVFMFFIQFALRIHHFRFDPQTEFYTFVSRFFHQLANAVGQLVCCFIPVSQALAITATRIFIGKPSVIQQEHIDSE